MPSRRQILVGGVPIGGGAPVAVQTMTKTETANLAATMEQIHTVAAAGADIVRVAVPREKDIEALRTIVKESPIPVIADIHFNHTLALKAIDAGAHCVRINPGNIGGHKKLKEVIAHAKQAGTPLRVGVNSGSLPKHLLELEFSDPVEALVRAAVETVDLVESLDFDNFKVSMKSTSVPNTIASNRRLAELIDYPLHLGVTEAGTKWSGSLKSAVGLGTLLADGIGEARHADFGITGAKDMGLIHSKGEPLKKVPTEHLVDELFAEIDRYYAAGKRVLRDAQSAEEARVWLAENEDPDAMTPERIAALEAEAARATVDEAESPVAGRRFTRA